MILIVRVDIELLKNYKKFLEVDGAHTAVNRRKNYVIRVTAKHVLTIVRHHMKRLFI